MLLSDVLQAKRTTGQYLPGLYVVFRSFSHESQIVLSQDVALLIAHVLILTLREPAVFPDMNPNVAVSRDWNLRGFPNPKLNSLMFL